MKAMFLIVLVLSVWTSIGLRAEDTQGLGLQRSPVKVNCNDDVHICSYVAQNITARELIAKINANLFPGSILSPSEGFLNADGLKKVNFYLSNPELLQKVISSITLLDTLEDFDPSDLVLLTTDIYSLSESGLSNLQASLVSSNSATSELAEWAISSAFGGPTGLALKIGTNLLSSVLGSSKVKEESSKVTTISQLIPNQSGINYSDTTKIYISPESSGVVKEEQAGLSLGGTVSISYRDSDLVLIKDYNLTYGVVETVTAGERVNILSVSNPQLYLVKGTSSLVVSSVSKNQVSKTEYSALSFGKSKEKVLDKIMIVTRAEAVNFKDYISDMKKLRQLELHQYFTEEEKKNFARNDISLDELLKHIIPFSSYTTSGDRVLGFKLDSKDARLNNITQNIEINVKSGTVFSPGLKQKVILPIENLMLNGFKFDSLNSKELKKSVVDINLSLKQYNGNVNVNRVLHYNPETNKFIE
jgi:hypothetical protein